jgi:hypothetical protein
MIDKETLKLVLEALEMADEIEEGYGVDFKKYGLKVDKDIRAKYATAITAIKQARAASVQEPVAWRWVPSKVWQDYVLSDDPQKAALARKHGIEVEALCKCTTPPAQPTPDLQAELEATNRQVEILSDALAESRREIARLKAVQEPVAWMHVMDNTEGIKANGKGIVSITQKRKHPFGKPGVDFSKSFPVTSTPLYTTQPAAQRQWVGLTDEEIEKACVPLGAAMMSFAEVARAIEAKLKEKNT